MIKKVSMITPKGMRGRYALVEFLTWLPSGLMIAPMVLLMSVRGLDVAQIGLVTAAYSVTVVILELPTGGLADVIGRRTVLAASAVFSVAGFIMTALAGSAWMFLIASLLKGVARALSSGPAQAWYVDSLHALEGPAADLKPGLAAGGAAGSVALAIGTLTGGVLPLLVSGESLAVPVWAGGGAALILLFTVLVVMREPARPVRPRLADMVRDVPVTVGGGFRLAVHDRGLGRLLLVAVAAGVLLNTIELLTPGRLAALTGRPETAGTIYAIVAAAGFAANAVGNSIAPAVARAVGGSMRAVVLATVFTAASVGALAASVALDGVAGMVAAGAAYVVLFTGLAVSSLFRNELIHQRIASTQRATVMSVDSLQLQFGGMVSSLVLVPISAQVGAGGVWAATALIALSSALLYVRLPAARAEAPVPVREPQ